MVHISEDVACGKPRTGERTGESLSISLLQVGVAFLSAQAGLSLPVEEHCVEGTSSSDSGEEQLDPQGSLKSTHSITKPSTEASRVDTLLSLPVPDLDHTPALLRGKRHRFPVFVFE